MKHCLVVGLVALLVACSSKKTTTSPAPTQPAPDAGSAVPSQSGSGSPPLAQSCSEGKCQLTCAIGQTCAFGCDGGNCQIECLGRSMCQASCDGGRCRQACSAGATCNFGCNGGNCDVACAEGADCFAGCSGSNCPQPVR
jgi:hypothetical protein